MYCLKIKDALTREMTMSNILNLIKTIKQDNNNIQKTILEFEENLNTQTLDISVVKYLTISKTLQRFLLKELRPVIKRLREKQYKRKVLSEPKNDKNSINYNLRMIYAGYPYLAIERLNKIISNPDEVKNKRLQALYHLGKFHINGTLGALGDTVASDLGVAVKALLQSFKSGNADAGYWIGRIEEQLINYPSAIKIYKDLGAKDNTLSLQRLDYINNTKNNNELKNS